MQNKALDDFTNGSLYKRGYKRVYPRENGLHNSLQTSLQSSLQTGLQPGGAFVCVMAVASVPPTWGAAGGGGVGAAVMGEPSSPSSSSPPPPASSALEQKYAMGMAVLHAAATVACMGMVGVRLARARCNPNETLEKAGIGDAVEASTRGEFSLHQGGAWWHWGLQRGWLWHHPHEP